MEDKQNADTDDGLFSELILLHDKEITQTGCIGGHVTYVTS